MKTMYKASMDYYGAKIKPILLESETIEFVKYKNADFGNKDIREAKSSNSHKWCDTKEEAKSYLRELCYEEIIKAKEVIKKAELTLSKIEAL